MGSTWGLISRVSSRTYRRPFRNGTSQIFEDQKSPGQGAEAEPTAAPVVPVQDLTRSVTTPSDDTGSEPSSASKLWYDSFCVQQRRIPYWWFTIPVFNDLVRREFVLKC